MYNVGPFYAQDSMCYKTMEQRISLFNEMMSEELDRPYSLPMHKEVCDVCRGEGKMVNRSIDGNGLSPDDYDLDEDFWDDYHSGYYDVTCDECNGLRVIDVVDSEAMSAEMLKAWDDFNDDIDRDVAMHLSEMRMGA